MYYSAVSNNDFSKSKTFPLEVGEIQQGCKMASAPPITANPCKSFQSKESVLEGQTPVISRKLVLKEGSKWKSTCPRARNHISLCLPYLLQDLSNVSTSKFVQMCHVGTAYTSCLFCLHAFREHTFFHKLSFDMFRQYFSTNHFGPLAFDCNSHFEPRFSGSIRVLIGRSRSRRCVYTASTRRTLLCPTHRGFHWPS